MCVLHIPAVIFISCIAYAGLQTVDSSKCLCPSNFAVFTLDISGRLVSHETLLSQVFAFTAKHNKVTLEMICT